MSRTDFTLTGASGAAVGDASLAADGADGAALTGAGSAALAAGATETGVTVHVIDEGVDTGPVLRQARVEIRPGEDEADLHERIKRLERPLLVQTVRDIALGALTRPTTR